MAETPISTPPTVAPAPAATDPSAQLDQQLQQLMQHAMQRRTEIPVPKPQPQERQQFMQGPATTHAEGNQMFFHNLGALVGNAAQVHKEQQIKKATGVLQTLHDAWDSAQESAGGDQQKAKQIFTQLPQVQNVVGDPKTRKQLEKMFQFDAMDPTKNNTVYHEAGKRVGAAAKIKEKMRAIQQALTAHKQQQQQPAGDPNAARLPGQLGQGGQLDQKPADPLPGMMADRARTVPTDVKAATEIAKTQVDLVKARNELTKSQLEYKDKYDIRPDKDGNIVAIDKTDPNKVINVTDPGGNRVTGQSKPGAAPKVAMVENVPYGVSRDGKLITPDSKEWTARDAQVFEAAKTAAAAGEANKAKLAEKRQSYFGSLPQAVMAKVDDPQKGIKAGELAFVSRDEAASNPAKYAPVGSGDKALGTQARFGEIQATVDMTNRAIDNLPDTAFDAKARAQIAYVLRAPDPASALDAFFKSDAATTLSDPQIDYVTSLASMAESAQAMTSLQGIGARGSDKLRASIVAMLPSGGTPSKKYAQVQMKKFQVELDQLRKGVPTLGGLSGDRTSGVGTGGQGGGTKGGNSRVIRYDAQGNRL